MLYHKKLLCAAIFSALFIAKNHAMEAPRTLEERALVHFDPAAIEPFSRHPFRELYRPDVDFLLAVTQCFTQSGPEYRYYDANGLLSHLENHTGQRGAAPYWHDPASGKLINAVLCYAARPDSITISPRNMNTFVKLANRQLLTTIYSGWGQLTFVGNPSEEPGHPSIATRVGYQQAEAALHNESQNTVVFSFEPALAIPMPQGSLIGCHALCCAYAHDAGLAAKMERSILPEDKFTETPDVGLAYLRQVIKTFKTIRRQHGPSERAEAFLGRLTEQQSTCARRLANAIISGSRNVKKLWLEAIAGLTVSGRAEDIAVATRVLNAPRLREDKISDAQQQLIAQLRHATNDELAEAFEDIAVANADMVATTWHAFLEGIFVGNFPRAIAYYTRADEQTRDLLQHIAEQRERAQTFTNAHVTAEAPTVMNAYQDVANQVGDGAIQNKIALLVLTARAPELADRTRELIQQTLVALAARPHHVRWFDAAVRLVQAVLTLRTNPSTTPPDDARQNVINNLRQAADELRAVTSESPFHRLALELATPYLDA